ncbi:MAG: deoxyguanosinetriphosphate triphosphohydrolase [Planctomycetota bacterium]
MSADATDGPLMVTRALVEAREADQCAPYAMRVAESRGRAHRCDPDPYRTDYQRDRDRIVHARAFRRLAYKTQVFANTSGDLFRSRLTHTMEVVQLARVLARRLGLNEDLVECIGLVHDLGHPPFGHRGEDMLAELMADCGGFEHNLQALRIVEQLERRYSEFPGLNLTYEVREGIVKHGAGSGTVAVPPHFHPAEAPLLEAQLVDEVDSIGYDCHDIDDALRAGIVDLEALQGAALWRGAWQRALDASPRGAGRKLLIDKAVRSLLDALVNDLAEETTRRLAAAGCATVADVRAVHDPLVGVGGSMGAAKCELEELLFANVYRDYRVNRTFHRARRVIAELFAFYRDHPDCLPDEHQARIATTGLERTVSDYIAGMTDRFALDEHARLF